MSSVIKTFSSIPQSFGKQVLSLTCHARLALASGPEDYELILRRTVREVKFYSEIVSPFFLLFSSLAYFVFLVSHDSIVSKPNQDFSRQFLIYFFLLRAARTSFLISSTVACLLFNLIIYVCLETLTGESLHVRRTLSFNKNKKITDSYSH